MGLTDTQANADLDARYGSGSPATIYFGLSTTLPTNSGSNITEPSGGSYARVAVTNNSTNFPAASARSKSNGTAITFPSPTGSWGTVGYWIEMSASTGGSLRAFGALNSSQTVSSGDQAPTFAAGAFVVSIP